MTHVMRQLEAIVGSLPARLQRDLEASLGALHDADPAGVARLLVALFDSARAALDAAPLSQGMPEDEGAIWRAVGADAEDHGACDEARRRLAVAFASLVARSVVGDDEMARVLAVDATRISQRLSQRSLYAFRAGGQRCFPRWQLGVPKLGKVLPAIRPDAHPLTVDHFFTTPNVDLEVDHVPLSPIDWLATGGSAEAVARLAEIA